MDKAKLYLATAGVELNDAKIWLDVYHKARPIRVLYSDLKRMFDAPNSSDGTELTLEARTRLVEMALGHGHDVVTELDGPEDVGYWHEVAQGVTGYRCPADVVLIESGPDKAGKHNLAMRDVDNHDLDDTEVCPECDGPASLRVGGKGTTRYYVTRCSTCGDIPHQEAAS